MKKFGKFALFLAPMIIEVRLASSEDVPDLDELSNDMNNGNSSEASTNDLVKQLRGDAQTKYVELMNDLVNDLRSFGYL